MAKKNNYGSESQPVKRLYKSNNKVLSGVCAGIGDYFNVDPVLIRILYILATVFTAFVPGLVAYILMAIIVPDRPKSHRM